MGITGTLLNSRPILAVYVLLLFLASISYVSVGYITYKKAKNYLHAKISEASHPWYTPGARTVLQGALGRCSWNGPLHGAVASGTCYARSPLQGCHGPLMRFEHDILSSSAGAVFSLVPLHLANVFVDLPCANHVTNRFGKGITPAGYRLTAYDVLSAGSGIKDGIRRTQLSTPPLPVPTGHAAFREGRQNGPMAKASSGKLARQAASLRQRVGVAAPTAGTDINAAHEDTIHVSPTKPPKEEKKADAATAQGGYKRNFRTKCAASPSFSLLLMLFLERLSPFSSTYVR